MKREAQGSMSISHVYVTGCIISPRRTETY
jgi:hypothetical protein